jgi:hypothetical protein
MHEYWSGRPRKSFRLVADGQRFDAFDDRSVIAVVKMGAAGGG